MTTGLTTLAPTLNAPNRMRSMLHTPWVVRWNCRLGFGISSTGLKRRGLRFWLLLTFMRSLGLRRTLKIVDSSFSGYKGGSTNPLPLVHPTSIVSSYKLWHHFRRALTGRPEPSEPKDSTGFFRVIPPRVAKALPRVLQYCYFLCLQEPHSLTHMSIVLLVAESPETHLSCHTFLHLLCCN